MTPQAIAKTRPLRLVFGVAAALAILVLAIVAPYPHEASTSQSQNTTHLEPGKPIEREMSGGETHYYQITLASDQYLDLVVDQKGIDVVVTLFGPDGTKLAEVDSPNGAQGPEPVEVIAAMTGIFLLEVRSLEKEAAAGRYEVGIKELRVATPQDTSRIAARRAYEEGYRLFDQGTAESLRKSIEKFEAALSLWLRVDDRPEQANTLHNLGHARYLLGETQQALDDSNQAFLLRRALGDRQGEASTLNIIGLSCDYIGEKQKALDYYSQSLALWTAVNDRLEQARLLNNIGGIYDDLGVKQKALDYYSQALTLRQSLGDRVGETITLTNIGRVYHDLNDNQRSLDCHNRALQLAQQLGDGRKEAISRINIGAVLEGMNDKESALDHYLQALRISRRVGDRREESTALNNIGSIYEGLGETQKALDYYSQSLTVERSVNNRQGEAVTLSNIGWTYYALGDKQRAIDHLGQALTLIRGVGDRYREAKMLYRLAFILREQGYLTEARGQIEAALNIIESLRASISDQNLRSSYFASVQKCYEFHIDLLMRMHRRDPLQGLAATALQASERARARSLLELLTEASADIRQGVDPTLLERERSIQRLLNAKAERQTRLLNARHTDEQAAAAAKEIEAVTTDYKNVGAEIRATSPRYAALTQPVPLSLKEIQQQVLDADTLLLEYALGDEQSYLWAISQISITSYELPKRAEIEAAARQFYELTKRDSEDEKATDAAAILSKILLSPVAAQLRTKRLVIVAEGILQYVPFAALPLPQVASNENRQQAADYRPLIVEHEIVSLPSASTLAVLRRETAGRKPAARAVAVLADPVFGSDDARVRAGVNAQGAGAREQATDLPQKPRSPASDDVERSAKESGLTNAGSGFQRLLGTRREAEAVLAFVPEAERKRALDFDASRDTATSADLGQYRTVLFATHGLLNSAHPELSGIVLSLVDNHGLPQDGFLRLHDIYNLKLPVELVVLSACQTALGKEIKGEGLVGLTRGFMYAGAPRVVASLWKVDDKATAELMRHFFRAMLGEQHLRPAAALRAAQIAMSKQRRWQAPYNWAAFVLQGDWR